MQFEATGTNGVQLNERLTGHNDATCNTAAGMRPAAIPPRRNSYHGTGGGRAGRGAGVLSPLRSGRRWSVVRVPGGGGHRHRSAESARSGGPAKFERQDGFKLTNLLYAYTHAYIG